MKKYQMFIGLFLAISVVGLCIVSCSVVTDNEQPSQGAPLEQLNQQLDRLSIEVSPGKTYPGYYGVSPDSMVQIIATGFPPGIYLHTELGMSDADVRRSVSTSQLDEEGKGSQVFFFPEKWDNGEDIMEGEMFLVLTWGKNGDQLIVPLQFRKD